MNKPDSDTASVSLVQCLKRAIECYVKQFRGISKATLWLSLAVAAVVSAGFGGNVGTVKTDYVAYMPFHEISMPLFLRYAATVMVALAVYCFWRGKVFVLLSGGNVHGGKATVFAGLRFLQFCMLAYLCFGIAATALAVAAVKVSAWIWPAFALYAVFVSVPLYVAEFEYMVGDSNFRNSLRVSFRAVKEQWGRVFLRLLITCAAVAMLAVVAMLPAMALALAVYDNATAVSMEKAAPTPLPVYVAEYVFTALGVLATLGVVSASMYVLDGFFKESKTYSAELSEARKGEF